MPVPSEPVLLYTVPPPYLHLATSEMWEKNCLCVTVPGILYDYNGPQRYKQFLQVGRLYWVPISLGLALYSKCLCVFGIHGAILIC